jgi:flagellar hook-associated protein 3 FlgL
MRITEYMRYQSLVDNANRAQERVMKAQEQVSTGKKINKPSDDPAAITDILRLNSENNEHDQYSKNLTFAKSKLQLTDTVLDNIEQLAERARTLGQASLGDSSLKAGYVAEVDGLRDQLITAANTTYAGRYIFGGTVTTTAPYVKNANSTVTYNGNSNGMPLEISRGLTVETQIPGSDLFSGSVDIFQSLSDLSAAMQSGNKDGIDAGVRKIEQFTDVLSVARTGIGGSLNLTSSVESNLSAANVARQSLLSSEQAADLAAAISDLTMNQNSLQATLALGGKISQTSIWDYL